jgi:ribosomal protein S18 acetylase RimI-like enzyme
LSIIIRDARIEDIPHIQDITAEAFGKYARELGLPQKVAALNETKEDIQHDLDKKSVLICLLDGKEVGSIRFEVLPDGIAYISRFGVKLMAQGHGIGRALMAEVEKRCRKMGVSSIRLHTSAKMSSLVCFYYSQGYYIHSTSTDKGYIRALLVRELNDSVESLSKAL